MSIFDNLSNAQEQSNSLGQENKDKKFEKILYYTPVLNKNGEPLPLFKVKKGMNKFDILPWIAETDLFGQKGNCVFDVCVDVNMRLGAKQAQVVSRASLGMADPVTDEQLRQFNLAKEKGVTRNSSKKEKSECAEWKKAVSLFAMKRSLYIINVYNDDGTKTPHLFAPAYNSFGKLLKEKEQFLKSTGQDVIWAHPTLGPTICINGVDDPFPGDDGKMVPFIGFSSIEVIPRVKPYPESIVNKVPALDAHLIIPTEDEVYEYLFGVKPSVAPVVEEVEEESEQDLSFSTPAEDAPELFIPSEQETSAPEPDLDDLPF